LSVVTQGENRHHYSETGFLCSSSQNKKWWDSKGIKQRIDIQTVAMLGLLGPVVTYSAVAREQPTCDNPVWRQNHFSNSQVPSKDTQDEFSDTFKHSTAQGNFKIVRSSLKFH